MGYGLPAAIAAGLHQPQRRVIAFAGDGCLQMTMQEIGTAMQYGVRVIIIVIDNGIYGTTSAEAITPSTTLSAIRKHATKK